MNENPMNENTETITLEIDKDTYQRCTAIKEKIRQTIKDITKISIYTPHQKEESKQLTEQYESLFNHSKL